MMTRKLHHKAAAAMLAVLLHISPGSTAAEAQPPAISFTARVSEESNVEGPDVRRTYFSIGAKRMAFGVPKGCRLSSDEGGFVLLPPRNSLDGEIRIGRSDFTPDFDLAANALKYRDAASADIPKGATNVSVEQPVLNVFPYNGWRSLRFTWSYSLYGRPLVRTVTFLNLEIGVQMVVTTVAAKTDAEKISEIARQFMRSWWVMAG